MAHHTQLCIVLFGTCLFSILLLIECRKLKGYEFPVYSTKECPGNQAEWENRSSAINCTEKNGYMCTPNENLTDLLEFCYIYPRILVKEGLCLYLAKRVSRVNSYNCRKFTHGCPELNYLSSETYVHPSCMEIENGCFSAEPSCKRQPLQRKTSIDDTTLAIILGVSVLACILCILVFYVIRKKFGICKRGSDTVSDDEETQLLFYGYEEREPTDNNKESTFEKALFDQWKQDDFYFISTKVCKEVERIIKSRNLVIVAGHSGSGKSAIIQHIALKYRKQGWTVKRVRKVEEIVNEYNSRRYQKNKTIFVFNDPFGKESFDEILNHSWQTNEKELELCLKTAKLVMSCRHYITSDTRVTRYLPNQSHIVNIDDNKYKLSVEEKRQILNIYTSGMNLSDNECDEIVKVEKYFPLLCKLFSTKAEYKNKSVRFFTEPIPVLREEIQGFRNKDKGRYCALALLVLFKNGLCVNDLLKTKDTENKFKHTLKLCGLPKSTPATAIGSNLDSLKDGFVKMIGNSYHFYHDLVMEVTSHVFVNDYPADTIKYADTGFLKRRVRLGDCKEHTDSFTIYLSDNYIEKLGERLFNELFGNHLMDVVLNPCLKNKKVIETLKKVIQKHPEKLPMLLDKKKLKCPNHEYKTAEQLQMSKLAFIGLENDISPLFVLIVLSHTDLSLECLYTLQRMCVDFKNSSLLSAVYCNGSMQLLDIFFKDIGKESLTNIWGGFFPIHIVSAFHNYEILKKLPIIGVDANLISQTWHHWTPLLLAVCNDTQEYGDFYLGESVEIRRNKTVDMLVSNGANINLDMENGASPLSIACLNGYDSTVQLLLSHGADLNLCEENGTSPLYKACQNGYNSTVELLLNNGADINLCRKDGASPLYIACENGLDSTVHFLLSNGADINLCQKDRVSPLYIACQNGHDSTVQDLLGNGADINLCQKNGASPLNIACQNGLDSTVQLLLNDGADINLCRKDGVSPLFIACRNGHNSTVQLLLNNGADINLCMENGASPLYIACQKGHDSTVQLLLSNGADINLCEEDGGSPLYIACQNGYNNTVQCLLSNGADINLGMKNGASPLFIACIGGHDSTVQLLLSNGADLNLCEEDGCSPLFIACQLGNDSTVKLLLNNGADINWCTEEGTPLYIACQNGHDSSVKLLLNNGADINWCMEDGARPLHIACLKGHDRSVQLLLNNGAEINLCMENGASPLHIACQNGHDSTVKLLLNNGADINLCIKDGASPLHLACENGHGSTVQLLLNNGADINLCIEDGASALYIACQHGYDSTVQLLLSNGADINSCIEDGTSPLYIACQNGHDSTVQLLLNNGADINLSMENGASPLHIACENGHDSTVQLLLNNGADINVCMENDASPLFIACRNGHDSTVQLLLNNGADINLCDEDGASPLYIACLNGHDSTVQLLLSNGAGINVCLKDGVSPLYRAFEKRRYKTVNILLSNGADTSLACGWKVNPDLVDFFEKHDSTVVFLLQEDNISNNLHDSDSYFSLFVSCQIERVTRLNFQEQV